MFQVGAGPGGASGLGRWAGSSVDASAGAAAAAAVRATLLHLATSRADCPSIHHCLHHRLQPKTGSVAAQPLPDSPRTRLEQQRQQWAQQQQHGGGGGGGGGGMMGGGDDDGEPF